MIVLISKETSRRITSFRDERDWRQFHNPKDLAISVALEAAELLECFQWSGEATDVPERRAAVAEEVADVMIYCELLCDRLGLEADDIVAAKLAQNEKKYPVAKAKGNKKKYTEL